MWAHYADEARRLKLPQEEAKGQCQAPQGQKEALVAFQLEDAYGRVRIQDCTGFRRLIYYYPSGISFPLFSLPLIISRLLTQGVLGRAKASLLNQAWRGARPLVIGSSRTGVASSRTRGGCFCGWSGLIASTDLLCTECRRAATKQGRP